MPDASVFKNKNFKMKLNFRQVDKEDNLALSRIIRQVFDEHNAPKTGTVYSDPTTDNLFDLFRVPGSVLWVAELNSQIIGCCGIYPTDGLRNDCTELVKFYLLREARGKGIGKKLLLMCIESAKEFGFTQIYLESLPQFSNAIDLYIKEGFHNLDMPLGDSKHSGCSIWMLKDLRDTGSKNV